jgi:hypothetical protein
VSATAVLSARCAASNEAMVCGKKEALREPGGERSSEAEAFCPIEATDAALVLAAPAGA